MKKLCVYHTRSGISESIARRIAKETGAELLAITDGRTYRGFFGYIAAAVVGLRKKLPTLSPYRTEYPLADYGQIIAVAPVWCEDVSPVMRAFLQENRDSLVGDVYFVLGHMSDIPYTEKINALFEKLGITPAGVLSVQTHKHDWRAEADAFVKTLREE